MAFVERLAIALMTGIFGFLIGLLAWWLLADGPGLQFGWPFYLTLSCAIGLLSFLLGLWRPERTIDVLGWIGQTIFNVWSEVLSWFRFLR